MLEISQAENGLTLPKLHTLLIDELPVFSLTDLQIFRLPSLQDVSVTFGSCRRPHCDGHWGSPTQKMYRSPLAAIISGNCGAQESRVLKLRVANVRLDAETLGRIGQSVPALEHLTLEHVVDTENRFFNLLGELLYPLGLSSKLRELALLRLHADPHDTAGLDEFLKDRNVELTSTWCM